MQRIHNVGLLAVVFLLAFGTPLPAAAQDAPKATFPSDGGTVTGDIEVVRVEFSETIDPTLSGLELRKGGTQLWLAGVGAGFCDPVSCQPAHLEPDDYTVIFDVLCWRPGLIAALHYDLLIITSKQSI